jgi:hypothetical protein
VDQVAAQLELAFAHSSRNQLGQAAAVLDEAESLLKLRNDRDEGGLDDRHSLQGRLFEIRAVVAYARNDYENAEKYWYYARDSYGLSPGTNAAGLGRVHTNLGLLLANRSEFEAAKNNLEAAIEIHSTHFGERHVKTAASVHNLAFTLFSQGLSGLAAEQMGLALEIYETALEDDHPALGDGYMLAGRIQHAQGELDSASRYLEQSAAVFTKAFGESHHQIGWAQVYLALVLADAEEFEAAFAALEKAGHIYELNYPDDDIYAGDLLVHRSIVLAKAGRAQEAVGLCRQGLALIKGKMSEEDAYVQEMTAACSLVAGH